MSNRRAFVALTVMLAAVMASACSGGGRSSAAATTVEPPPVSFLSIGGSATEGDGLRDRQRDAWTYLVFHNALPRTTTLVNAATDDGTAAGAVNEQAPLAAETKPDIVAMWLGPDDVRAEGPR